ncbi:MAG: hypothetical protein ACTFAK_07075 [Candidatus Electronema sp. VV]
MQQGQFILEIRLAALALPDQNAGFRLIFNGLREGHDRNWEGDQKKHGEHPSQVRLHSAEKIRHDVHRIRGGFQRLPDAWAAGLSYY